MRTAAAVVADRWRKDGKRSRASRSMDTRLGRESLADVAEEGGRRRPHNRVNRNDKLRRSVRRAASRRIGKNCRRWFSHFKSGAGRDRRWRPNVATEKVPGEALAIVCRSLWGWERIVGQ
jgi:hypothetical protein